MAKLLEFCCICCCSYSAHCCFLIYSYYAVKLLSSKSLFQIHCCCYTVTPISHGPAVETLLLSSPPVVVVVWESRIPGPFWWLQHAHRLSVRLSRWGGGGEGGGGRPMRTHLPDRAETSQTRLEFNTSHSFRSGGWGGGGEGYQAGIEFRINWTINYKYTFHICVCGFCNEEELTTVDYVYVFLAANTFFLLYVFD